MLSGMKKSLDEILAEVAAVNSEAQRLCEGLTEQQLGWRPAPNRWSIAETLAHLNLTTQIFLPSVDRAIEIARREKIEGEGSFSLGTLGSIYLWYTEPPPKIKLPAPKVIKPILQGPAIDALPQFLRSQQAALARVDAARGLDCEKVRFSSPLASIVKMNLISFFAVMTGHQRRHLVQMQTVRDRLNEMPHPLAAREG